MYFIGLDVHKRTISYCVKDAAGCVHQEGKIGSTRRDLDCWIRTLPQPRTIAMEATIFTGWIYDHLLPHAEKVKVAHPLMLRAIAAAKKKNDKIDAGKIADCLRCDFLPECHMAMQSTPQCGSAVRCEDSKSPDFAVVEELVCLARPLQWKVFNQHLDKRQHVGAGSYGRLGRRADRHRH
jgi:hypothetical protein